MRHHIKKTLAMMSLLAPLGVQALGIGEIKLHSALNQNLRADIPLINTENAPLSEIKVSLASPQAFARAGIERLFFLNNLRFKPIKKPGGAIIIRVTSVDVVREPFIDFLVELNWPQGRVLREYTLLLDPPVIFKKKTITVTDSPVVTRQQDVQPTQIPPVPAEPKPDVVAVAPPARQTRTVSHDARSLDIGDQYGPVAVNDTLWKVVKSVRTDSEISDRQLMVAIYENNRHAFYKNNINALKAGQTIDIPERDVILKLSKNQALAEYKRQNDVWYGRISDTPSTPAVAPETETVVAESKSQLKLLAPPEGDYSEEVSAPGSEASGEKSKAEVAIEMTTSLTQENQELKSRLAQLEEQMKSVQRLLSLKDEQLAALQSRQIASEQTDLSKTEAGQESLAGVDQEGTQQEAKSKEEDAVATPKKPATASPSEAEEKPSWLSEILSDPMYLAAGGVGAALLGLLALIMVRRKRSNQPDETESILAAPPVMVAEKEDDQTGDSSDNVTNSIETAESSFLSEFSPSDFDALESEHDEVDPISEADVYLAYGRYQQAEDLIRKAIEESPERDDRKLKLLEIHYARENREAFESYATELSEAKRDDTEFWGKVEEMGRELCPTSALFAGSQSNELTQSNSAFESGLPKEVSDFDSGTGEDGMADDNLILGDSKLDFDSGPAVEEFGGFQANIGDEPGAPLEFDPSSIAGENVEEISVDAALESVDDESDNASMEIHDFAQEVGASEFSPSAASNDAVDGGDLEIQDSTGSEFSLDGVESKLEEPLDSGISEANFSDPSDMDEVETKLDLAKACVDMDDIDTARDILDEILENGNENQKSEAKQILGKIEIKG